jgi:hypothetical protein
MKASAGCLRALSTPFLKPENQEMLTKVLTCQVAPVASVLHDLMKMIKEGKGKAETDYSRRRQALGHAGWQDDQAEG